MNARTHVSRIAELLARVKAATGPVDHITAAGWANTYSPWPTESEEWHLFIKALGSGLEALGAALALMKRCLPSANCYGVERDPFGWNAYVSRNHVNEGHWLKEAVAPTAPLAILAALLIALQETIE